MSFGKTFSRLWSTVIPMPHGPVQMIGYPAPDNEGLHLAFVNYSGGERKGPRPLWVIPAANCGCAGRLAEGECNEVLAREFQRFMASPGGLAIALYQHPEAFGRLMVGASVRHIPSRHTGCFETQGRDQDVCQIWKILDELKMNEVYIIYPPLPASSQMGFTTYRIQNGLIHNSHAGDS